MNLNVAELLSLDLRWRLWANDARYIVGEITKAERDEYIDKVMKVMDN